MGSGRQGWSSGRFGGVRMGPPRGLRLGSMWRARCAPVLSAPSAVSLCVTLKACRTRLEALKAQSVLVPANCSLGAALTLNIELLVLGAGADCCLCSKCTCQDVGLVLRSGQCIDFCGTWLNVEFEGAEGRGVREQSCAVFSWESLQGIGVFNMYWILPVTQT